MALDFIPTWASAIAQFEGFNSPGTRPQRNNNPGDLKYAGQAGAIGKDRGGFAVFPDTGTGFQALYNQLSRYISQFPNDSILDIMAHYLGQASPGADAQGNAYQYANFVASQLGVDPSTTLSELATGAPPGLPVPPELTDQGGAASTIDASLAMDIPPAPAGISSTMILAGIALIGLVLLVNQWE